MTTARSGQHSTLRLVQGHGRTVALTVSIVALVAALVVLGWLWARQRVLDEAVENRRASLETSTELITTALDNWAEAQAVSAEVWAADPRLAGLAERLVVAGDDAADILGDPATAELRALLAPVIEARGFRGFFLVRPDGLSIGSTRDTNVGTTNLVVTEQPERFARVMTGEALVTTPQFTDVPLEQEDGTLDPGAVSMFAVAPVRGTAGDVIAAFMFRLDPDERFTGLFTDRSFETTGEAFAFDAEGRLLTPTRFADEARAAGIGDPDLIGSIRLIDPGIDLIADTGARPDDLDARPATLPVEAVAGRSGNDLDGYRNHFGRTTVGAWQWDELLEIGIAVEMERGEALRAGEFGQRSIDVLAGLILVALAALVGYFLVVVQRIAESRSRAVLLADEIAAINHQVQALNTRLSASNADLERFASVAAHDLQEPLRKVQAFGSRLERAIDAEDDVKAADSAGRMISAASRMQQLVENLLEFARANNAEIARDDVDLGELLASIAAEHDDEDGTLLVLGNFPTILGDEIHLRRVITNLVSNGLKFRDADRDPVVEIRSSRSSAGEIVIEIADNGIGFTRSEAETIFTPYQRLHSRDRYPGTGMGLSISRRIIARHGGTLTARGRPGEGATFVITLPNPARGEERGATDERAA